MPPASASTPAPSAAVGMEPALAARSRSQSLWVMAVLATLMAFGSISTDLYLPAMPQMARDLGAGTGVMEFTISGYLVGFSLGQLLWGAVSDRVGRRWPIAIGILLFILGSAGCALAATAPQVVGWRVVQAIGACAGVVLSRAMVRDLFPREQAAQKLSMLIVIMAAAPLVGPLVGGQLLVIASWHWIFWLLVAIGLVTLVALFTVPETLAPAQRDADAVRRAIGRYGELLRDRRIIASAGIGGFFYAGAFAYIAGTPFAFITYYHVPPRLYALLFGAAILGIMAVNMLNARLAPRFGSGRLLRWGAGLAAVTGIAAAITAATGWGGLAGLAVPLLLFCALNGLIVANSLAAALSAWPERAGAASALVGAIHYGSGIVGSALLGVLADGTPWPLGLIVALGGLGSLACTRLLPR